jgi:hypothetical protein
MGLRRMIALILQSSTLQVHCLDSLRLWQLPTLQASAP